MLAIAHNTYLDYVSYNKSKGYFSFGEDLWNALKEQEEDEVAAWFCEDIKVEKLDTKVVDMVTESCYSI